ncbi:helix-turn-helix domain-containing protein [Brevibacterium sp.]|uniref:TetR/AcrR family transcriptional regulator n=1 Tax=Brevibacterium sp. TaxID=1701 RepID=UPI0028112CA5|nr:helix-turn-helix domain-containing protein [Brevibacterium sp.]
MVTIRALRTRARILDAALDLFERQGYDATTVNEIAEAAGITPMTFFRHFPTKDAVLVTDPYDPLIAEAIGTQPVDLAPLERTRRGLLAALGDISALEDATAKRRVALVAESPALRAAAAVGTEATQQAIVERLVSDGAERLDATVAAAVCLAAATAALLAWGTAPDDTTLAGLVRHALTQLAPDPS